MSEGGIVLAALSGVFDRCEWTARRSERGRVLLGQMLDKDDKLEIIARGDSEANVAVGEGASFAREPIAPALVPSDESVAHVDDGHLNGAGPARGGVLF
jgi:hypothetical protein